MLSISPIIVATMIDHGGALQAAIAAHGGERADWLDLSTGISPVQLALPELGCDIWRQLPDPAFAHQVSELARAFYNGAFAPTITPGSQAAIQHLPHLARHLKSGSNRVAILSPTYGEYEAAFARAGFEVIAVASLTEAADFDVVVLANPNNPDGRQFDAKAIAEFASSRGRRLTVVDEAFADMHPEISITFQAGKLEGLVVLRSFGKFFGLAGLRLGFVFASSELTGILGELLGPWAVSGPALEIARHAFSSSDLIDGQREAIAKCHAITSAAIANSGCEIVGKTALFFLLEVGEGAAFKASLAKQNILVRAFTHSPSHVRIGLVGNDEQAARLQQSLAQATSEVS